MSDRLIRHLKNIRLWIFTVTGGILFAAFDRCGYMLKQYGSIWAVSENPLHRTILDVYKRQGWILQNMRNFWMPDFRR